MTTAPVATCYRHPDRETGRRCTRCGRPACPECLRDASVGAQCVECVQAAAPSRAERVRRTGRGERAPATKVIIGINVAMFLIIAARDGRVDGMGSTSASLALFGPAVHSGDWYRLFTSSVVHYGFLHLFFNMMVLWLVGSLLEPGSGPLRFSLIYVVSVLSGAAGALILSPHALTGGAS